MLQISREEGKLTLTPNMTSEASRMEGVQNKVVYRLEFDFRYESLICFFP